MRWRKGYLRIVKRFALFPIKTYVDSYHFREEWRWLETVYLEQTRDFLFGVIPIWRNDRFVDESDYKEKKDG